MSDLEDSDGADSFDSIVARLQRDEPPSGPPRVWVAIVLSLIVPGAGHIVRGRWQRGLAWVMSVFVFLPLILHWTVPTLLLTLVWHVAVAADAALCAPHEPRPRAAIAFLQVLALVGAYMIVGLTIRATIVEAFEIPSGSMIPTLQVGDHIFVSKRQHTPERGDVIVFEYPRERSRDLIKRVIGVGGDTVELRGAQVIVNGQPIAQEEVGGDCKYDDVSGDEGVEWLTRDCKARRERLNGHEYQVVLGTGDHDRNFEPVKVPPGAYYVLGDNRDNSHDSRFWGFVPGELVRGTALRIWWSNGPHGLRWERFQQSVR
jgi:signal peptidase I